MTYTTDSAHLSAVVAALNRPAPRGGLGPRLTANLASLADQRWAYRHAIEDILYAMDSRLDPYGAGDVDKLLEMFGYHYVNFATRPRKISTEVFMSTGLAVSDLAELLMRLEQLGFRVDPAPLADAMLERLAGAKTLSASELSVLWFEKTRHRGHPIELNSREVKKLESGRAEERTTSTGYRVEVLYSGDAVFQLRVHAPKYRHKPNPVRTVCEECGVEYYRGDPESTAAHRREHKKRAYFSAPEPNKKLLEARQSEGHAELVKSSSPRWKHAEMYGRALAFRREFGYDFVQWGSEKADDDPFVEGHLLADEAGTIVGACSFRLRGEGKDQYRALQWIWLAPRYRRTGHLSRHWQAFRDRYGAFHVEDPVSEAMQAFLARREESWLMDLAAVRKVES